MHSTAKRKQHKSALRRPKTEKHIESQELRVPSIVAFKIKRVYAEMKRYILVRDVLYFGKEAVFPLS